MVSERPLTPLERRDRALQQIDAGHRALHESLVQLDHEEAFLGSRWSVWEILKHLNAVSFVDSLEKVVSGQLTMLPPFTNREERLKQDMAQQEATFQRFRTLVASLSEEQLTRLVTPPNPHNAFPGLTMLELIERIAGHEATHSRQITATRQYLAAFACRERAVVIAGLGPGDPALVSPRIRELVSNADYVAGTEQTLAIVRPWIRGVENALRNGNEAEVLSRMSQEARNGIWSVVCCLGDPLESNPGLVTLARQYCDHVVVYPGLSTYQLALAACQLSPYESLSLLLDSNRASSQVLEELCSALRSDTRNLVLLGSDHSGGWSTLAQQMMATGCSAERTVVVLSDLSIGGGRREETTLSELAASAKPFHPGSVLVFLRQGPQTSPA